MYEKPIRRRLRPYLKLDCAFSKLFFAVFCLAPYYTHSGIFLGILTLVMAERDVLLNIHLEEKQNEMKLMKTLEVV
jgi:hypothetical protein